MGLTDRQRVAIEATLNKKGINPKCPICGGSKWELANDMVAAVPTSVDGGMALGGPHVPMIQLVCTNCGFVSHHAAKLLGVQLD